MPSNSDSVKVAVRVRPFNQREKNAGSACIISMKGNSTTITDPNSGQEKTFSFDHSYWSHDGFIEDKDGVNKSESDHYADQRRVFSDLGKGVLDNAWQGYNAALFAYGQTGSGKSYSMIGYGPNKGIVPITCEELFKVIESNKDKDKQLQVSFSMLEIYNEKVRDLLVKNKAETGSLKIRQDQKMGFYVEGLKHVPVRNYKEIEKLMEQGTVNRTTASTNMNATSSRSHMVITIRFNQVIMGADGKSNTRSSDINLVDLAGSERSASTGATGDRLREGSAINQSLSTLGNVISALADQATSKKKVIVPYRNSVLTMLLQSALGGNSRTIMIAALSPAAINYDETLSTLRYADRAKRIQNKAVVNESPTERLIRELKEENAKLLSMLSKGGRGGPDSSEGRRELQRMLQENERRMNDMNLSWEQRLEQARKEWQKSVSVGDDQKSLEEFQHKPYITNINEDPQLSGIIKHCFNKGKTVIGKTKTGDVNVQLRGLGIQPRHAIIHHTGSKVYIEPAEKSALVFASGHRVREKFCLSHLDRIRLGSSCLFLYIGLPEQRTPSDQTDQYNYDYFMMELAEHEGVTVDLQTPRGTEAVDEASSERAFQEYVRLMPLISEANAISEELSKTVHFDAEIKSDASHDPMGKATGREVIVRVTDTKTKKIWMWPHDKFLHRKDLMDELYSQFMEDSSLHVAKEKDPFWDPVEDIFLGSCHILLQSLSYGLEVDEHFTLHNYHGKEEAVMHVQLLPCNAKGQLLSEDDNIYEPAELLGQPFHLSLILNQYMGVRWNKEDKSRGVYCRYKFFDSKVLATDTLWGKSTAEVNYSKDFVYRKFTEDFLRYLSTQSLVLELWGKQVESATEQTNGYTNGNAEVDNDMLKMTHQVQYLKGECEDLKKENFKLKKTVDTQKQALEMSKAKPRRGSIVEAEKKRPVTEGPNRAVGLDVDLAKALKIFFKDVRDVQNQVKEMRQQVMEVNQDSRQNGNLKVALEKQDKGLHDIDNHLASCVQNLKQTVASTLRKGKS
ncbi:kinesin-like protein KIF28P isoform X3 [Pecten maximus]|uniref:kinesin-like protein KIF28P isoform X3 n=1 Tax=Pecten maximus TaxID=6579 RepID=UPI001458BCB0|nr:kinesin-like protein KIF28P isoform X3 [Pecten maximus]